MYNESACKFVNILTGYIVHSSAYIHASVHGIKRNTYRRDEK